LLFPDCFFSSWQADDPRFIGWPSFGFGPSPSFFKGDFFPISSPFSLLPPTGEKNPPSSRNNSPFSRPSLQFFFSSHICRMFSGGGSPQLFSHTVVFLLTAFLFPFFRPRSLPLFPGDFPLSLSFAFGNGASLFFFPPEATPFSRARTTVLC